MRVEFIVSGLARQRVGGSRPLMCMFITVAIVMDVLTWMMHLSELLVLVS